MGAVRTGWFWLVLAETGRAALGNQHVTGDIRARAVWSLLSVRLCQSISALQAFGTVTLFAIYTNQFRIAVRQDDGLVAVRELANEDDELRLRVLFLSRSSIYRLSRFVATHGKPFILLRQPDQRIPASVGRFRGWRPLPRFRMFPLRGSSSPAHRLKSSPEGAFGPFRRVLSFSVPAASRSPAYLHGDAPSV